LLNDIGGESESESSSNDDGAVDKNDGNQNTESSDGGTHPEANIDESVDTVGDRYGWSTWNEADEGANISKSTEDIEQPGGNVDGNCRDEQVSSNNFQDSVKYPPSASFQITMWIGKDYLSRIMSN